MDKRDSQDAYGHEMLDYFNGAGGYEIMERDDGYITAGFDAPKVYFSDYRQWTVNERKAIRYARGKVLDVGCGAGRMMLYLKKKGHYVMGIDSSPLAVKLCRKRGLKNVRELSITQVSAGLGIFDTILMFGGNFGLMGNPQRAGRILQKFYKMTSAGGLIIAVSCDPYRILTKEAHEYQKRNRAMGKMSGCMRYRIRYRRYISSWYEWLMVSRREMQVLLKGTGWAIRRYFHSSRTPAYIVVIGKE